MKIVDEEWDCGYEGPARRGPHGRAARCLERCAGDPMHVSGTYPGPSERFPRAGYRWWSGGRRATSFAQIKRTIFVVQSCASHLGPPAPPRSVGHPPYKKQQQQRKFEAGPTPGQRPGAATPFRWVFPPHADPRVLGPSALSHVYGHLPSCARFLVFMYESSAASTIPALARV